MTEPRVTGFSTAGFSQVCGTGPPSHPHAYAVWMKSARSGCGRGRAMPWVGPGTLECLCVLYPDCLGPTQGACGQSQISGKWRVL